MMNCTTQSRGLVRIVKAACKNP